MHQIMTINPKIVELNKIKIMAKVLGEEGVIVYPTDTFYGLGADCFSQKAAQKIYSLKRRDASKPLSVVIADIEMAEKISSFLPSIFSALSRQFWPGPLTLVLKAKPLFPQEMLGPESSLAVRVPNLPWLRELIRQVNFPITATSANISGEEEISSPEEIIKIFSGKVDLIVDGGKTRGGLPSTIVDLISKKPRILREGAIPARQLTAFLSD